MLLVRRLLRRSSPCGAGFLESQIISVPLTVGWLWPKILLPLEWREWDREKLDAVLAHEGAHVRRRDGLVSALAGLNRCIFWFHPLAWMLERRLALLAELACDESCVATLGNRESYARLLLDMARVVDASHGRLQSHALSMAASSHIRRRIDSLLQEGRTFSRGVTWTGWATVTLCGIPIVLGAGAVTLNQQPPLLQLATPRVSAPAPPVLIAQARPSPPVPSPAARPEFEVATVKASPDIPGERNTLTVSGGPGSNDPERIAFKHCPLKYLILYAFGLPFDSVTFATDPLVRGPGWIADGEKYEVIAKVPPGTSPEQARVMLQNLLVARFKADFRRESKETSGYELTVAKGGTKLKESPDPNAPVSPRFELDRDGFPILPDGTTGLVAASGHVTARNKSIEDLIKFVAIKLSVYPSAIIDRTGLTRTYDFAFQTEAGNPLFPGIQATDGPGISEALEKQLGLKLEKRKVVLQILVVEHAERVPTEN
ncbi:MAG TPA: M56 family metallopeptidase [Bryobacteraceae bacterium]|jgi:uncharacterized protein (TIGR03435 family)